MTKYFVDAGTTWSKILEVNDDGFESSPLNKFIEFLDNESSNERYFIIPSSMITKLDIKFDAATGHMVKKLLKTDGQYTNEIIALAQGGKNLVTNTNKLTLIDLGSRDSKWIRFEKGKYKDLDWNNSCGSATGATVEMLCKFYNVHTDSIRVSDEKYPVTCGVFAMEKIMDDIASDVNADYAISKYIHGLAFNTWNFAQNPAEIYLSGGFCKNKCFVDSLKKYCKVHLLGRFVLLKGLDY